jgi:hypothetical protein
LKNKFRRIVEFYCVWFVRDAKRNSVETFGSRVAFPIRMQFEVELWEATMRILAVEIFVVWSVVALLAGLAVGAVIGKADRIRKDEFLSALFSNLANLPTSR